MKYLILAPGAMGYYALLGCLKANEVHLKKTEEISGASAGAMLAFFLAVGLSVDTIVTASLALNVPEFVKLNVLSFFNKFGFIDMTPVRDKILEIAGCNPTFRELKLKIHIASVCLNTSKTEYFSADTHPDMKVIDAVCMSIAIPFLFTAQTYNNRTYVDGALIENIPYAPFLHRKHHEIYCFKIKTQHIFQEEITTHRQYVEALIRTSITNRKQEVPKLHLIEIDLQQVNVIDFTMGHDQVLKIFFQGLNYFIRSM